MATVRLGLGGAMNEELIKKACSMAMKAHESPAKPYLLKKSRSLSNVVIFSFPGSWSANDWFTQNPFGEKKIDLAQFGSLKKIATDRVASVNGAFLNRFQAILPNIQQKVRKFVKERKQIVFTGHSSGGPIAILMTVWFLEEEFKKTDPKDGLSPLCITFGSPLVGDLIFNHAVSRENWSQYFTHFVMRYDIVPRVSLAPLCSIEQELTHILLFLNPRSNVMQVFSAEASALYVNVMRNVSSLASHSACHLMRNTYNLSETLSNFFELSPYRPFGTYVFCTGNGELVIVKNPDAVLQILFYSSQLSSEQEHPVIAMRSIKDHQNYQSELQSLEKQNVIHLDSFEGLPLSSDYNDIASRAIDVALNNLGLGSEARLCLCAAREFNNQKLGNQKYIDDNKMTIEKGLSELEQYKIRCENRKVSYYDAFKISKYNDDFNANVQRLELAGILDELMKMVKKYELPDGFECNEDWIKIGTRYRRLLEPLDIANYHRHLKNEDSGPYMINGRDRRYKSTQKWHEYIGKMESGSSLESCFWAEVEELDIFLKNSNEGLSAQLEERIQRLEKNVETWVSRRVLGPDVFFQDSTFFKWWRTLPQQYRLGSSLSRFINE